MGDCFGEVAFFTEIPQMQTVRTVTVCRVLVVPRSAYQTIKSAFPLGTRQMLDNLQAHAELVGDLHPCSNQTSWPYALRSWTTNMACQR